MSAGGGWASEETELAALSIVWAKALADGETVVDAPPGPISSMLDRVYRAFVSDSHALETLERARRDGTQDSVDALAGHLARYAARDRKLADYMLDFRGLLGPGDEFQYTGPGTQDVKAAGDAFVAGGRKPGREPAVRRKTGVTEVPGVEPGGRLRVYYREDRSPAKRLFVAIAQLLAALLPFSAPLAERVAERIRDWLPGFFSAVRACLRVAMLATAVAYLAFMIASYRVPFSPGLGPFVEFGGGPVYVVVLAEAFAEMRVFGQEKATESGRIQGFRDRVRDLLHVLRRAWSGLRGRWGLAVYGVLMVAVLVMVGIASWSAGLSFNCANSDFGPACLKIDNFAESHGEYFRQYPYDAQGNSDPGAAWVPISRGEYVAEFGTYLRYTCLLDVGFLGLALAVSVLEEGIVSASRDRRRLPS